MCSVPAATRCTRIRDIREMTESRTSACKAKLATIPVLLANPDVPRIPNTRQASSRWACAASGPAKGPLKKGDNPFSSSPPRTTRARGRYYLTSSQVVGQIPIAGDHSRAAPADALRPALGAIRPAVLACNGSHGPAEPPEIGGSPYSTAITAIPRILRSQITARDRVIAESSSACNVMQPRSVWCTYVVQMAACSLYVHPAQRYPLPAALRSLSLSLTAYAYAV